MFDIGFTELLLVGIVALIVVGPERLPSLVRTTLSYVRQFKASFSNIRDEVERELALDDLKKDLHSGKDAVGKAVGYDELHASLDELRQETSDWKNIDNTKDYPDEVSDAEIEADLEAMVKNTGPQLPAADSQADTGIEPELEKPKSVIAQADGNAALPPSKTAKPDS